MLEIPNGSSCTPGAGAGAGTIALSAQQVKQPTVVNYDFQNLFQAVLTTWRLHELSIAHAPPQQKENYRKGAIAKRDLRITKSVIPLLSAVFLARLNPTELSIRSTSTIMSLPQHIDPPKYPVVDPSPSLGKVMSSFRSSDWRNFTIATALSLPFGYAAGRPVVMRPSMYMAGILGATFGICLGFQNTFSRLTGYKENSVEVVSNPAAA